MPQNQEVHQQRRQLISEIIRSGDIGTQAELVAGLRERGFTATQSSISRDLNYLGVAKVSGVYVLPATYLNADLDGKSSDSNASDLSRWVRTVHAAGPYLLVVRTAVGAATQVALLLDQLNWPEIIGTVAGDDTIFLATESKVAQSRVARRLFDTAEHSDIG
ncbi:MAG: transcriptional regulator of arginine metabolism [Planctomycetota bacterium]|jgi:transcriptional regulator of arginine metabolism